MAGQCGLQNSFLSFKLVLQILCHPQQCAFWQWARKVHDDNWKFREVEFTNGIAFSTSWKIGLCFVHGRTDFGQCRLFIPAEFELQHQTGIVLGCGAGHGFQTVQVRHLVFHDFDQQLFAVFRRNARERNRNKCRRNLNVWLALFGKSDIRNRTRQNGE